MSYRAQEGVSFVAHAVVPCWKWEERQLSPSSERDRSAKQSRDSPANNVGPWPASLGCTMNSYSSIVRLSRKSFSLGNDGSFSWSVAVSESRSICIPKYLR